MESRYWTEFAERHRHARPPVLRVDYRLAARPLSRLSARPRVGHSGRPGYLSRYHPVR